MIYFTSDLHFCHDRQFIYGPRGFNSIKEHDETIVKNWNSIVQSDDTVYILGDLMLNNNEKGIEYLRQLNGFKFFIRGNHDTDNRKQLYQDNGILSIGDAHYMKYNGYHFYLSHYPTLTGNLEKESLKQMTLNLFGHTHQKDKFYEDRPYMYCVGLDAHNCFPVSIDTIIEDMKEKANECLKML